MISFAIPAFNEPHFTDHMANKQCRVVNITEVTQDTFFAYNRLFEENGLSQKECRQNGQHYFAAYAGENVGVFLNFFASLGELNIVIEENCRYFSYQDTCASKRVPAQITQVHLEDYGMSYVIRLSDGRLIVIDGGWKFEPDIDNLLRCLQEAACGEKPVIAAWILTHPHADHFHCCVGFLNRYADQVVIEKFFLHFPKADDFEHYPALQNDDFRVKDTAAKIKIPELFNEIEKLGVPVYMPHTGQVYSIGDAVCEILATIDDTIHLSKDVNMTSLVFRMELADQVILWTADAGCSYARLPEKYGTYLRADILQVPHHGFQSGGGDAEIRAYDLIQPRVCFMPVPESEAYGAFCTYRKSTRYLMTSLGIDELITGPIQRTITLPYTPPAYAKQDLQNKLRNGLDDGGARTWVFTDLHTACEEDFVFTILNMAVVTANVCMELFFENSNQNVNGIQAKIPAKTFRRLCIVDANDVNPDAVYFNWMTLATRGVPENVPFAVRFISDTPVVISHKTHTPAYRSNLNR